MHATRTFRRGVPIALMCVAAAILGSLSPALARHSGQTEPWADLDQNIDTTRVPQALIDSIVRANGVADQAALRTVPIPLRAQPERLVLEVTWGLITAGYGVLSMTPDTAHGLVQLSIGAVTTRFVGAFFKVRDYIRVTLDAVGVYPLFSEEHIAEGRYQTTRWALFDHRKGVVFADRKKYQRTEAPPFTQSFLSILYYLRTMQFAPGDTFTIPCFVQGKVYPTFFSCTGQERVRTRAGNFSCLLLEPRLVDDGRNFSKHDRIKLWVTDDERRMPVRVRAKIQVGTVDAELIYYEAGGRSHGEGAAF